MKVKAEDDFALDKKSFTELMHAASGGKRVSNQEIDLIFSALDTSHDGLIQKKR